MIKINFKDFKANNPFRFKARTTEGNSLISGLEANIDITPNFEVEEGTELNSVFFNQLETDINKELDSQAKQITDCNTEIGKVKEQIAGIDVTTDMEDVVTRLVNTDRTKPLNTLINEVKTAIINHVTSIKDVIVNHVTSQHTATKTHITTEKNTIISTINTSPSNKTFVPSNSVKHTFNITVPANSGTMGGNKHFYLDRIWIPKKARLRFKFPAISFTMVNNNYMNYYMNIATMAYGCPTTPIAPGTLIANREDIKVAYHTTASIVTRLQGSIHTSPAKDIDIDMCHLDTVSFDGGAWVSLYLIVDSCNHTNSPKFAVQICYDEVSS